MNERVQSLQSQGIGSDTLFWCANAALQRALTFLEQRQLPSGEFPVQISTDRSMATGCAPDPSVFPTALIAHCLCFSAPAARLRERALRFLAGQMDHHGLWRHWTAQHPHYRGLPPDLDDTACASAVLSHAGRHVDNRELMLANRNQRGLFLTWVAPRPAFTTAAHLKVTLAQLRHAPTLLLFFKHTSAALYDVDAVVNANCLFYLNDFSGRQLVIDHLLGILEAAAETVCDKWYENPFVIWYFFSRALQGKAPRAGSIIERRLRAMQASTALEAALAFCSLSYWNCTAADTTIIGLLASQLESGAWQRAALYHGGRTRRRDGSFETPHPDTPHWGSEELTTAFCIEALAHWLRTRRS